MGRHPQPVGSRLRGRGRHRALRCRRVAVRPRRRVRAVPDLRQRALALRAAPGGPRSRLPCHVRRPDARSKDANRLDIIDFFVYSRAAPSAANVEHDPGLDEEHWSYMDGFSDGMIARGPTLAADRETWTGSVHILDLPSADAAREFVGREPYNRAGL